jgi:hypothetical protein
MNIPIIIFNIIMIIINNVTVIKIVRSIVIILSIIAISCFITSLIIEILKYFK